MSQIPEALTNPPPTILLVLFFEIIRPSAYPRGAFDM